MIIWFKKSVSARSINPEWTRISIENCQSDADLPDINKPVLILCMANVPFSPWKNEKRYLYPSTDPFYDTMREVPPGLHFNGKTYWLNTPEDIYNCYTDLSAALHNYNIERALSKV